MVGIVFKIKVVNLADWSNLWHAVYFKYGHTSVEILRIWKNILSDQLLQTKRWWEAVSSHSRRFCICHIAESLDWVEAGRSYFKGEKGLFFFFFVRFISGLKKLAHPHASENTPVVAFLWDADSCLYCTILLVTLHLSNGLSTSLILKKRYRALLN